MIEPGDIEDFKIFVKALCFWASFCERMPSGCRACLQKNGITIVDNEIALDFRKPDTQEVLMSVYM